MAGGKAKRGSARQGPCRALALSASAGWQWAVRRVARRGGSRSPAPSALRMALPVAPVIGLTTGVRLRGICAKALCLGWLGGAAEVRSIGR